MKLYCKLIYSYLEYYEVIKMCTVSFKIDDKEKVQAQELFESMGLSFSGAINLFIKACLNSRSIPFEIKAPSYEQILKNRIIEANNPENLSPSFNNVDKLMESLDA